MRIARLLAFLACVWFGASHVVIVGQQYGVTVKASKPAALAKAKTYVWTTRHPAFDKNVHALIVAAVDRELGARGFTQLSSGQGDVLVTYASLTRTDIDLKSKSSTNGAPREYLVGTLVVEMSDPTNRQPLFQVRMDTPIRNDSATLEGAINGAVTAMFDKYPKPPKH